MTGTATYAETAETNSQADQGESQSAPDSELRARYIDLLRETLTMSLWNAADGNQMEATFPAHGAALREDGRDWPKLAHTMTGVKRMKNLQFCVEDVIARGVPCDFIETGVWRGGSCIFMRGILAAYGERDRKVWVADSFEGLPPPDAEKYPVDAAGIAFHLYPQLAIPMEEVQANFRSYGLLDDQVVMLKGFFKDTLPHAEIDKLAVLRLDGDMYESTMDALTNLYSKLSDGGYLIVDDYAIPACSEAINDFREAYGITDPMEVIDWTGVYWQKGSAKKSALEPDSGDSETALTDRYTKLFMDHERIAQENRLHALTISRLQAQNLATANELAAVRSSRSLRYVAKVRGSLASANRIKSRLIRKNQP